MPMHVLALPLVSAKRVPRRKRLFHADLKHIPLSSLGPLCSLGTPCKSFFLILFLPQKSRNLRQTIRHPILRQRLQKNLTIRHARDAAIEQRQNPAIRLGPNQPPKPLLQSQDRLRHLKLRKRIPPVLL